jgi:hypothetical protein
MLPYEPSAASNLGTPRFNRGNSYLGVLKPDATPIGVDAAGNRTAVMIEFDRTQRPSKQLERLRRYDCFLNVGWRESRYAVLDIEPAVLIVCDDERLVEPFARAADGYLTASLASDVTAESWDGSRWGS